MNILMDISLNQGEKEVLKKKIKGQQNDNFLHFKIDNIKHIIDLKEEIFKRENEEYLFFLDFLNKKCILTLKSDNYNLDIPVVKCHFLYNEKEVILDYFIESYDTNICLKVKWDDEFENT